MLLNSWEGLKTRCSAIASPSDVTKRQEEQDSFTPLEGEREDRERRSSDGRQGHPSLTARQKPPPSSTSSVPIRRCYRGSPHIALGSAPSPRSNPAELPRGRMGMGKGKPPGFPGVGGVSPYQAV